MSDEQEGQEYDPLFVHAELERVVREYEQKAPGSEAPFEYYVLRMMEDLMHDAAELKVQNDQLLEQRDALLRSFEAVVVDNNQRVNELFGRVAEREKELMELKEKLGDDTNE